MEEGNVIEGEMYDIKVSAKNTHGEGIGKINDGRLGNFIVFIKNAKTRIGKIYKVKITRVYRTFAYAEPIDNNKYFIGNGTLIV